MPVGCSAVPTVKVATASFVILVICFDSSTPYERSVASNPPPEPEASCTDCRLINTSISCPSTAPSSTDSRAIPIVDSYTSARLAKPGVLANDNLSPTEIAPASVVTRTGTRPAKATGTLRSPLYRSSPKPPNKTPGLVETTPIKTASGSAGSYVFTKTGLSGSTITNSPASSEASLVGKFSARSIAVTELDSA